MPIPDEFLKHEAYEGPGEIGEWGCGRELAHTAEEDWRAEKSSFGARKGASDEVDDDGHDGAGEPEILQTAVEGAGRENSLRTDEAKYHRGVEEDARPGTGEVVRLARLANSFMWSRAHSMTPSWTMQLQSVPTTCAKNVTR